MAFDYINEAFKKLDFLNEQMFDTSLKGLNELSDFMNADIEDETVSVIDPEATSEEELQDSYVGKVIINCNVCHSHVFENKEDVKIEEDGAVNIEESCPYCGESEGFVIIGEIAPFGSIETEETEEDIDEDSDNNDSETEPSVEPITEDFKEVKIVTDDQNLEMTSDENGKVTIVTEPIATTDSQETSEETIVPVSDETEEEILSNNDVTDTTEESDLDIPEESTEESTEESSEEAVDFDEVDEESMNVVGESYLREVYDNISSFKTTDVYTNDNHLVVEGIITFKSGTQKKTGFLFESKDINSRGQLRFVGTNKHLTESMSAYTLVAKVSNKKLCVESLKYNYMVEDTPVRGIARTK